LPVDGFFEWKAIKGKVKQPYAIAMKDGYPFGLGGIWGELEGPNLRGMGTNLRNHYHRRE
jgi:putative SOS response-associated peptidase YedK